MKRFSARAGLAILSTAALLAAAPVASAFAADGPDFSKCQTLDGRDYGQCVAQVAQDFQNGRPNTDRNDDARQAPDTSARDRGSLPGEAGE